jgi:hypothetical protein
MESNRERFSVGEIQCVAISDGTFSYPTGWFFSNVPPEQLEGSLRDHDLPFHQVLSPYTCLLVNSGREKILIDTGADGLAPTTGGLLKNLKAEGITRDSKGKPLRGQSGNRPSRLGRNSFRSAL